MLVVDYLENAGLLKSLSEIGFKTVGFGCTTCIGNSGPLPDEVAEVIEENSLHVAAVSSGNRNFEGRVHPLIRLSYLGSPPLVAAEVQVSPSFELSGNSIWDRRLHPYSASCLWSQLGLPAE